MRYLVWDKLNGSATEGRQVVASDVQRAAELYAETDRDGQLDGLYTEDGHALCVRNGAGAVYEITIVISQVTHFEARASRRQR